jgi:hypothetical protein
MQRSTQLGEGMHYRRVPYPSWTRTRCPAMSHVAMVPQLRAQRPSQLRPRFRCRKGSGATTPACHGSTGQESGPTGCTSSAGVARAKVSGGNRGQGWDAWIPGGAERPMERPSVGVLQSSLVQDGAKMERHTPTNTTQRGAIRLGQPSVHRVRDLRPVGEARDAA